VTFNADDDAGHLNDEHEAKRQDDPRQKVQYLNHCAASC
jgi:hypothetical protein